MIIPLPFIVSLLFTIIYATNFDYKIELERCKVDTTCFVRQACITDDITSAATDDDKLQMKQSLVPFKDEKDKLEGGECDAVVQIKQMNQIKFLVLMQLTSANDDLDTTQGFGIIQDNGAVPEVQIECKDPEKPTGREDAWILQYEGLNSLIREGKKLFCSLIISAKQLKDDETTTISDAFRKSGYQNKAPSLYYTQAEKLLITSNKNFWTTPSEQCDGEISVADFDDNDSMFKTVDTSRMEIKCPPEAGKLNVKYDGAEVAVDTITCTEQRSVYSWSLAGPSFTPPIKADKKLEVSCRTRYCTQCTDLPSVSQEECPTCAQFISKEENGCKTLTCLDDKFTVDGKNELTSPKGITCNKNADGTIGWNLHNTDDPQPVIKASCYIFKGCKPFPKLNCPEGVKCKTGPKMDKDIFNYTCPDADAVLQQNKKPVTPTCDKDTHEWKDVDTNADLYCAVDETKTDANTDDGEAKGAGAGLYIGIVFAVILIGAAGVFLFWKFVYKKRQDAKKTTKKEEGTSKKSSKKVESKSGGVGSSNEAKKDEKKSDPNKESEKPAAEGAKDGKETPKDAVEPPKETPKDAAATPAAAAATPGAPPTPGAAAPTTPATPAADSAPAPADVTPV